MFNPLWYLILFKDEFEEGPPIYRYGSSPWTRTEKICVSIWLTSGFSVIGCMIYLGFIK